MPTTAKRLKVVYKRIRREYGYTYGRGVITVDQRLKGKKLFEILIHESLHELFPEATEEEVTNKAAILTRTLWAEGYRRADTHEGDLLQDGKK